ncbi:hypothetical protein KEJ15_09330, partial [Candidatus Bathyarchaeota archaeon]|nr:hypothetical protein [Candidatus Bathyarchaeota archaeon]
GNRILPKHIWKPICEGDPRPSDGQPWDPTTFAPDPNCISHGPWLLEEYAEGSHLRFIANKPGATWNTGLEDPNADPTNMTSPYGFFKLKPKDVTVWAKSCEAKIDPGFPSTSTSVTLLVKDLNLISEWFRLEAWVAGDTPINNPAGSKWHGAWPPFPQPKGILDCNFTIKHWVDQNITGKLDKCDFIVLWADAYPGRDLYFHVQNARYNGTHWYIEIGEALLAEKYVYVNGNLINEYELTSIDPVNLANPLGTGWAESYPNAGREWTLTSWFLDKNLPGQLSVSDKIDMRQGIPPTGAYEYFHIKELEVLVGGQVRIVLQPVDVEKPGIPIIEQFQITLSKCKNEFKVRKHIQNEWSLCKNNAVLPNQWNCTWIEETWPVWITIPEDITGSYYINPQLGAPDCKVDLKDVLAAALAFGSNPGHSKWNSAADINHDYKVDLKDYFAIAGKFGKW